jgi:hypothetical protein
MRLYAALVAVVLASPALAQPTPAPPSPAEAPASGPVPIPEPPARAPAAPRADGAAGVPEPAALPTTPADLARIKRRLDAGTPLLDAAMTRPTFRTSVTGRVDIWRFWGEPDAVSAFVRPHGGSWHHEFQDMVTPDAFKGYGGILGNGEKLQLAATSLAFAGAMRLLGIGVQQAKDALHDRTVRKAKEEVQRELEAFYQLHPEARPAAAAPAASPAATPP